MGERDVIDEFERCLAIEKTHQSCESNFGNSFLCRDIERAMLNCFAPLVVSKEYDRVIKCRMRLAAEDEELNRDCQDDLENLNNAYSDYWLRVAKMMHGDAPCLSEYLTLATCAKSSRMYKWWGLRRDRAAESPATCMGSQEDVLHCVAPTVCNELFEKLQDCRTARESCHREQHEYDVCSSTLLAYVLATLRREGIS